MAGKGHNELLEIVNPLVQTRVAINVVQLHTPENRVSHVQHVILASARQLADITATNLIQKPTSSQVFVSG
jgi:hypothetical protein